MQKLPPAMPKEGSFFFVNIAIPDTADIDP
jgi:hypothetical protein